MKTFKSFLVENQEYQVLETCPFSDKSHLNEMIRGATDPQEDSTDLHKQLWKHYNYDHSNLEEHRKSISNYGSTTTSQMIGTYLHEKHSGVKTTHKLHTKIHNYGDSGTMGDHISNLDDIASMHKSPTNFHVYTGLRRPFGLADGVSHGLKTSFGHDHIKGVMPAYTSTSLSHSTAAAFAVVEFSKRRKTAHMIKIHIPEGSNYGGYISAHTGLSTEREFLLKRGTRVHIDPEPEHYHDLNREIHSNHGPDHRMLLWHAKIV